MTDRVVIIGGGIAGLATALTLARRGYEPVVVERDPEPPDITPDRAFSAWSRPGVPQFRHAHLFLGRLQAIVRVRYPKLYDDFLRAGLELSTIQEVLPNSHAGIAPEPGDEDLRHFWGRRATFEYVLRRHVGELSGVRFIHSARVTGLVTDAGEKSLRLRGVEITRGGRTETLDAALVVDASGKRSKCPEWLRALGARVDVDCNPSNFVYACRHYRLKDPASSPPRRDGGGNLDYLGYATFYAEHGHFALTFGCPVEEKELAAAIHRNEGFEALCERLPVLKQWTNLSEATSKVLGSGRFENRWAHYERRGGRQLSGFFAVGDSHVETNPMYGRGCTTAFVQSEALGEAIDAESDPGARARHYHAAVRKRLKAPYDLSIATDRMYHVRARIARGLPVPLPDRFISYAYDTAWMPALHQSPIVAREMVKALQMADVSSLGRRLAVMFEILGAGFRSVLRRSPVPQLPAASRVEFLRGLPATGRPSRPILNASRSLSHARADGTESTL